MRNRSTFPSSLVSTWSTPWYAKAVGIVGLYIMWGHPGVFMDLWQGNRWPVLAGAIFLFPVVSVACLRLLRTKLTIGDGNVALRKVLKTKTARIDSIVEVERIYGAAVVKFVNGQLMEIPSTLGDLNKISAELRKAALIDNKV